MTVAHDANTRFPTTGDTYDTTTGSRTFNHTPTGTPKGVVCVVMNQTVTTAVVSGVLYGDVNMTLSAVATDTSEVGRIEVYTLTDSAIPTGVQVVTLLECTATSKWCAVSTVTAATLRTTVNASNAVNTTTAANPTMTITTTASTLAYCGFHGGASALTSYVAGAGVTNQNSGDYGALVSRSARRSSQDAAGSVVFSWTYATSDDYCIAGVALAERADATEFIPDLAMAPHR